MLPLCGGTTENEKIGCEEEGRELFKEMDINGIHVKVYISNTPSSDDSMQRVIDNLIAAYEERIANKK